MPTKLPPKPYKTVQQQLDTYKQRGLIVDDNKKASAHDKKSAPTNFHGFGG